MTKAEEIYHRFVQYEWNEIGEGMKKSILDAINEALRQPPVVGSPIQLEPVLAEIEHINDLGKSKWYEVVYFFEKWCSYAGSKTFEDGEQVVKWKYVKDCL